MAKLRRRPEWWVEWRSKKRGVLWHLEYICSTEARAITKKTQMEKEYPNRKVRIREKILTTG